MWIILLAPKEALQKQYFALVGVFGSIMALVHPVFYPYPFPHVSSINNVFWSLGPLGQLSNLSGSILPGERRGLFGRSVR